MDQVIISTLKELAIPFLSFVFGSACTWFFRQKAQENAIKCLLRDRMIQGYNYHIKQNHTIQRDEYNSFMDMAEAYLKLKGPNGYLDKIIDDYRDSPLNGKEKETL